MNEFNQDHAILDENGEPQVIRVYDENGKLNQARLIQWATWFERSPQRRIAYDELEGDYSVSTVFLGLNHNYKPGAPPLWFETIAFAPPHQEYLKTTHKFIGVRDQLWGKRTSTKAQALAAHAEGLAWLTNYLEEQDDREPKAR
jgi:hypothetical protein